MKVKEFIEKNKFSESSGVVSYISADFRNELNEYGIYEEKFIGESIDKEVSKQVINVSQHLNVRDNEFSISKKLFGSVEGVKYNEMLGYYLDLYVGHASKVEKRSSSSSGGIATWILTKLLDDGHIDGVIHVTETTECSKLFKYTISRTISDIEKGSKTKYYPVELSEVLEEVRNTPGRYAIVGIPSFIYAVRLLQNEDPIIRERIVYTVGLVCGHQKSTKFAEAMAWQMGIKPGDLKSIDFRHKLDNHTADDYGVKMVGLIDGTEKTVVSKTSDLVAQNWGLGMFKVYSSDFTDDVMNETADITLGDAWLPQYTEDSAGNNVIIIRNKIISEIIKKGLDLGEVSLDEVNESVIIESQIAHYRHTREELSYRLFLNKKNKLWNPKKRVEIHNKIPYFRKKIQRIRKESSQNSHLIYKEAVRLNDFNHFNDFENKCLRKYKTTYKAMYISDRGLKGILLSVKNKISKKAK